MCKPAWHTGESITDTRACTYARTHARARACLNRERITVCTCVVRSVAREDDRPLRSIAALPSEARTPACAAACSRDVWDTCAITTWRDRIHNNRLRDDRVSWFATSCRALSDTRCQSQRVTIIRSLVIARAAAPSAIGHVRPVVLQTERYFNDVTDEAGETMRTMFFEKPVAAITASEIGVFARPIGKKEPMAPGERIPVSYARTYVRTHAYANTRSSLPPFSVDSLIRWRRQRRWPVVRGRARVSVVGYRRGVARRGTFFFLVVVVVVCLSLLPPVDRSRRAVRARSAARSYVTSATPPHVVNTKHGRRTDIRWSSASQAERVNWPQYELPRAAAMRR